jgi:hypothetical protein
MARPAFVGSVFEARLRILRNETMDIFPDGLDR